MKVLMLSADKNIFKENSPSRERMIEYGKLTNELHIIIFTLKKSGFRELKISENVFLYPTNSFSIFCHIFKAYKVSKKIILRNGKGWIVTSQDPFETGIVGFILKRKFKIKWQAQIHTDFLSLYFLKESLLNKIRVRFAKFLLPRTDGIRVVSERIKKSLTEKLKIVESKISILPVYVNIREIEKIEAVYNLREKYQEFNFIIFMASRLSKEKNINLALKSMEEIVKIYSKTGLVIAGDGKEKQNLLRIVSDLRIGKNVKFLGNIEFKALISYYKTADMYLLTSNYEGYAMSVVEAAVCGAPVVMTDVGLANDILIDKKDALIIPAGDHEVLKSALINLIQDENLRKTLVKNAKNIVNLWKTKEEYLKEYYELWRKLLL